MNIANMRTLVRTLRTGNPVAFDMGIFFRHGERELRTPTGIMNAVEKHPCKTAACLAGHAAILGWESGEISKKRRYQSVQNAAREWLGLDNDQAHDLFYGYWGKRKRVNYDAGLGDLTKAKALTELRRLINNQVKKNKRAKR